MKATIHAHTEYQILLRLSSAQLELDLSQMKWQNYSETWSLNFLSLFAFLHENRRKIFPRETRKFIAKIDWTFEPSQDQDTLIRLGEMAQLSPKTTALMLIRLLEFLSSIISKSEEPPTKLMKAIQQKLEETFELKTPNNFFAIEY